jgi:ribosomal protein L34E
VKDKKKIIVCEHCGRILADVDTSEPVETVRTRATSLAPSAIAATSALD